MQFTVITKNGQYMGVAPYSPSERYQDEALREWAEEYVSDHDGEMLDIDYHEGGEITITDDNILISGDNGIIQFEWFYQSV